MFPETRTAQLPKTFWVALLSVLPMTIGAFGPWANVLGVLTVRGTEDSDGWSVVGAAVVAAGALLLYARRWRNRWLCLVPLLAGGVGVAVTASDLQSISTYSDPLLFGAAIETAEWGIYVALAGSCSLVLASLGLAIQTPDTAERVAIPGSSATAKIRNPWAVFAFAIVSFGLYYLYWYYQANRELKDVGVGRHPVVSLLAFVPGALLIVPPVVSWWRFIGRLREAQAHSGCPERIDHALGMVLYVVGIFLLPLELPYTQRHLNALWERVGTSPAGPAAEVLTYENYAPAPRTAPEA